MSQVAIGSGTAAVQTRPSVGPEGFSRRALLRGLAGERGGAAAISAAAFWRLQDQKARASEVSADVDPGSQVVKLVRRVTFGLTQAELMTANSLGYDGYLEHHLNYTAIDDSALASHPAFSSLTTLSMTPMQLYALAGGQVVSELIQAVIVRAVVSRRQLFERMVEFWTDHFNIEIVNGNDQFLKTVDDRDVIRAHALGTFPALLSASAHSPAMLLYLDNNVSTAIAPNENYARELMELHTLGVDGGYTQEDVEEVARCFTGWGFFPLSTTNPTAGTFRYTAGQHDNSQKIVLGNVIPAGGGMQDGVTVLNILANHPSTANFIAKKLCRRLLAQDASQSVIDSVAATYTATGGDIKAMIRTALSPNNLYDAAPKYKRPFHLFVSAFRALPTTITATSSIRNQLTGAGHQPFYWGPPDGYPDNLEHWSGLILPRWNFGASLLNNSLSGVTVDTAGFFTGLTTADQMADRINQSLFAGEMAPAERNRIRDYLLPNAPTLSRQREAIGLSIGSPGFQWH